MKCPPPVKLVRAEDDDHGDLGDDGDDGYDGDEGDEGDDGDWCKDHRPLYNS